MSIFKRPGSPFYQCEFVYRKHRVVRSTGETQAREARAFERQLRDKVARESREVPIARSLTLDQACAKYYIQHGKHLRWHSEVERHLTLICKHIDKDLPLASLGPKEVTGLVVARQNEGAGPAGVNRTLAVLQGVHRRAARKWEETVRVIAWSDFKLKEPRERVRWITQAEALRLLVALPPHIELVVRFLLLTGVRKLEAFLLTWDRVHFDRMEVQILAKGGHKRAVALSPDAMLVLHQAPRVGRYVFDTTNARRHFDKALKVAGITDFHWHDLRHTHASWLGHGGAALEVISRSLGHSGIAVTMKYRHVMQVEVREALQRLPALSANSNVLIPLKR